MNINIMILTFFLHCTRIIDAGNLRFIDDSTNSFTSHSMCSGFLNSAVYLKPAYVHTKTITISMLKQEHVVHYKKLRYHLEIAIQW